MAIDPVCVVAGPQARAKVCLHWDVTGFQSIIIMSTKHGIHSETEAGFAPGLLRI